MTHNLPKTLVARATRGADAGTRAEHEPSQFDNGDLDRPGRSNSIDYTTGRPATSFGYDTETFMARQYRQ